MSEIIIIIIMSLSLKKIKYVEEMSCVRLLVLMRLREGSKVSLESVRRPCVVCDHLQNHHNSFLY